MAGIALLLDALKKNPSIVTSKSFHSYGLFSASIAASAAAASRVKLTLAFCVFSDGVNSVAFADAGTDTDWEWENYVSKFRKATEKLFQHELAIKYSIKEYPVKLKSLYSAFEPKAFGMTTLRAFLMYYLPLLEPRRITDEDEDEEDYLDDDLAQEPKDLVVPFKKSVKQIAREVTISTTRRILERLAVHYVSRRMAWKLLKDLPVSARRKAARGMPNLEFFCRVSRTTFRGHLLGITAAWLVQVGLDICRCCSFLITNKPGEGEKIDKAELMRLIGEKICITTVKCGASLVFASIGAGIGASFHPSIGQWIGCAVGDVAGSFVVTLCLVKILD
ncbi:hypothetical protein MKW94_010958 [Papaver nudicaule]|uniref:Uncharacterized protein n=1 Tax=Papaver nudicaule TaxID=74823 RepID=A0AA42B495_PAPNU|nr:hypothetical protein [Papaver nudicaule]